MAKQIIRLTESDLHRLVKESVQRILREFDGSLGGSNLMVGDSDESGGIKAPGLELKKGDKEPYERDIVTNVDEKV